MQGHANCAYNVLRVQNNKFLRLKCKNKCMIVIMIDYGQIVESIVITSKGHLLTLHSHYVQLFDWISRLYVIPFKYFLWKLDYNVFVRSFYQVVFERREWNASNTIVLTNFVGWCKQYVYFILNPFYSRCCHIVVAYVLWFWFLKH